MKKTLSTTLFFLFIFSAFSQEVVFRKVGGQDIQKAVELNMNNQFGYDNYSSGLLKFDFIFYPSSYRRRPYFKNLHYGIGAGAYSHNMHWYGKANVLYYWLSKFKIGFELSVDYAPKDGNYNLEFLLRKDIKFAKHFRLFGYRTYAPRLKLFAGLSYSSYFKTPTINIGAGVSLDKVTSWRKPVVYFYSKDTLKLEVELDFKGDFTFTWPKYNGKWDITVLPNSELIDNGDNKKYSYLFWEGTYLKPDKEKIKTGFIVKHKELASFLSQKLVELGLNDREINDFITYWVPVLHKDKYLIHFLINENCNSIARYKFSKKPESLIRVLALFIETDIRSIKEQDFPINKRGGFTVIEWGGAEY